MNDGIYTAVTDVINDFNQRSQNDELRVKVVPVYVINEKMMPVFHGWSAQVVNHFGIHSINASGLLPKDIVECDIMGTNDQSQLCTYIADVLRSHRELVNNEGVAGVTVESRLYSQQTMVALAQPVTIRDTLSICYNRHYVVRLLEVRFKNAFIYSRVLSSDLARYYKMTTFNNQQLEHYTQTVQPFSFPEAQILRNVTTACLETGTAICDNRYIYFKL